jgi:two-component system NtrC family sensor kinase
VLVVDDMDANLVAMDALLSGMGCEVVLAKSGNDALRQLLKNDFAVLLLDVQMPEMDGYEVARYVREYPRTQNIPIIFLTATSNTEDNVLRGYGSGAVDFLFKPLNPTVLRSKVRVFLDLYISGQKLTSANEALEREHAELLRTNGKLEKAYETLQAAQVRLVQSAKMASLGELVAGIAHEINNPLAFVMSLLGTVRQGLAEVNTDVEGRLSAGSRTPWRRAHDRLAEMAHGLDRIRDLVAKLRAFSRLDEGEWKTVSLRECVDSVTTILGHRFEGRIRVGVELAEPDSIYCMPSLLNQALMNLVANAIDAIDGQGAIDISSSWSDEACTILVTDTGSGIPEDLVNRVVEPFFTTKPVGQGTGLGLSITYSIVQKHGGMLELRRASGGGAAVAMIIPRRESEDPACT